VKWKQVFDRDALQRSTGSSLCRRQGVRSAALAKCTCKKGTLTAFFLLANAWSTIAAGATVTVIITGVTGAIQVGEGPLFGQRSYQPIPAGSPFILTYTFDEEKGKPTSSEVSDSLITRSGIENSALTSPGTSASLQIGNAVWEFGASTRAQVTLKTAANSKSEEFLYATQAGGNRVSSQIVPAKGSYWPKNGDWRASFTSSSLDGSAASFSADNNRVDAKGSLVPLTISVTGVDIDGQWLSYTTAAEEPSPAGWEGKWQLAHASPKGGYIVEEVTRTILGIKPDGSPITPSLIRYWQARQVPAGANASADAVAPSANPVPGGSSGEESVSVVARFYEGLRLPVAFAAGNSPYAASLPSSTIDPGLSPSSATLPVAVAMKFSF
jgi:hypothetical protein